MHALIALFTTLLCLVKHSQGTTFQTFCSRTLETPRTIHCKCNELHLDFAINMDDNRHFEDAIYVNISHCRNADLDITMFDFAKKMRHLTLREIEHMTLESFLPASLKTFVIEDIGLIPNIHSHVLVTKPQLKEFTLRNSVVELMNMDVFIDVSREKMTFDNVTFLNISYDKSLTNDKEIDAVEIKGCYFTSDVPSFGLQFSARESYDLINCTFLGALHEDAIHAKAPRVQIKGNVFTNLHTNAISLHHYNNEQSLHLYIVNNTIKYMSMDAVSFQENLKNDLSAVSGNRMPCTISPQCDEKAVWVLKAIKHVTEAVHNKELMCNLLNDNYCIDIKTNVSTSLLFRIARKDECEVLDVTLLENINNICYADIKEIEELRANGNAGCKINNSLFVWVICLIHLWMSRFLL